MLKVLIVDDNQAVRRALQILCDIHDIACETAASPMEAEAKVRHGVFGAVVQDMNFSRDATSGKEGEALFRRLRELDPGLPIILITAWSSLQTAVKLVKEGADDYLEKPYDDDILVQRLETLLKRRAHAAAEHIGQAEMCGLVFADVATGRVVTDALRIAPADVPVLITGPNGVGKEKIAEIIQANSPRSAKPFIQVNAGALPENLVESELFGNESGAFTGAAKRRVGRFEEAAGGTLFLDEIGNLSLQGQIKLLRVLQTGEFSRLGSNKVIRTDVRVISATNENLQQAIAEGRFREDLYFRLNVVELKVPPLKERGDDIEILANHFLASFRGAKHLEWAPGTIEAMLAHTWPGNVRELQNRVQRAVLLSDGKQLTATDLGLQGAKAGEPEDPDEVAAIEKSLMAAKGNISRAASELGMSRQALYRRMEKYGIVWEKRPR